MNLGLLSVGVKNSKTLKLEPNEQPRHPGVNNTHFIKKKNGTGFISCAYNMPVEIVILMSYYMAKKKLILIMFNILSRS